MIDLTKLSALQEKSKHSFAQQKQMIKKLTSGQQVLCSQCKQALQLNLPVNAESASENKASHIACAKGCTDIQLDVIL